MRKRYAKLCRESGLDIQVKECSATMLRSRAVSGQYLLLLFSADLMDAESVADADCITLHSTEMR